ncbi:MAG: flagellar motor protein [Bacillota bacterium]|uniref:Flagellar motor protein n=1 Tax=Thermanaerosceptrum fracticalcis TaxID=1712410 RepID=A0A7G6E109_THEFR|nr:flagellar motor protein [Thermanaerosceptrum fracticalcis]QNB45763.1 flagellar motor protein [Thermanaerosceptrum fracticalcis]
MDLATIIGAVSGIILIVASILVEGELSSFWSLSSAMIVLGGTMAATLINYPLSQIVSVMSIVKVAFKGETQKPAEVIITLVKLAEKARREGLLALEAEAEESKDEFLKKGIQLIVDGTDPELVRNILETEISFVEERHKVGAGIFEAMGASAPAFGMLGTLIGLILMLRDLNDPSKLGPGMAVALITTFYGSLLANLLFLPIAGKLKLRSSEELLIKEVMIEGILSIQAGENPRIVGEKMKAFLEPKERMRLEKLREEGTAHG